MYLWELLFVSLWFLWSLTVTIVAFYEGATTFDAIQAREFGAYTDGTLGTAMSMNNAMKVFTFRMILAFGTWISAYVIGQTADELLGFFDQYSNDTGNEGKDKKTGDLDPDGTSIEFDLLYHSIIAAYAYVALSAMMLGANWFVMAFDPLKVILPPDCDLSVSASTYAAIKNGVPTIRDMTYA